ncbi:hypothetical protein CCMSSC00406_0003422 [Pleurotus cornucopiae]|uniref:Uncharacterized protein n=1 Tax=Pleurotus cornucopiae TaxID=5321 RepID=A0ACB7JAX2_PLECO|nr:hypothetical protein CCMSSC00406_0003422 [Pleurotus cornucopiae]
MSQEPSPELVPHVIELNSATDGKIVKVHLSPGRAEVTRVYKLALEIGVNQVKISGLPEEIDDTIRVEGRGDATIYDVSITPTSVAPSDPAIEAAVAREYRSAENEARRCKDASFFLENFLRKVELVPCDHAQIPIILRTHQHASSKLDSRLIDIEEELEKLRLSRTPLSYLMPLTATVVMVAEHAGEAEIALVYAVPNASWNATYDIRIDMQSEDAPFSIRYKAVISQSTGENWDSVQLTLDTFTPNFDPAQPRQCSRERSPRRDVVCDSERSRARSRSYTPPNRPPRSMTYATVPMSGFGGLNATYDVPGLISIPNEAQAHIVTIAELKLDASFSWLVVPKLDLSAHLKAQVKNVSEYTLVAGPTNVYIDGSFVARSRIPDVSPQESFECSLGVDPSIRITYAPLSKKLSSSGLINKTTITAYSRQATIRNTKSIVIENLKILDRIPISEDSQIVVKLIKPALSLSKPPQSPSENRGMLDKAGGYQVKTAEPSSTLLKVAENVSAQWEGEDGEEGTGRDGRISWLCTVPPQGKVSVNLQWEESTPMDMKLAESSR